MSQEFKSFLKLMYSLCKQYITWFEQTIKEKR